MSKPISKTRLTVRIDTDVADLLKNASSKRYGTMSDMAEAAIRSHFLPGGDDRFDILARRVDALQKTHERIADDQIVVMQAINTFVWFYLMMTPPLPTEGEPAAKALALKRYQKFLTRLGKDVRGNAYLSDLVLSEDVAEEAGS